MAGWVGGWMRWVRMGVVGWVGRWVVAVGVDVGGCVDEGLVEMWLGVFVECV